MQLWLSGAIVVMCVIAACCRWCRFVAAPMLLRCVPPVACAIVADVGAARLLLMRFEVATAAAAGCAIVADVGAIVVAALRV